ncbi:hypothetical protein [Gaetbulibacter jejuensis]|uniref:Uncharacterized protein n=1 Tax=Gaetbulibacter jejuensis TaxID=584607 RepID=A0ABP3UQB2_9FLAO
MALENLISIHFTAQELQALDAALVTIAGVLQGKAINLTPAQRQQYGSIAEQNKLLVNKAKQLMQHYPQHVPSFLDLEEFGKDYEARQQIEGRLQLLKSLLEQFSDTKILLDHDNYFTALSFYRNLKYLSGENVPGTTVLYHEMRQFFTNGTKPQKVQEPSNNTPATGKDGTAPG